MKKAFCLILSIAIVLTITACSSNKEETVSNTNTTSNSAESVQNSNDTESVQDSTNDTEPAKETLSDKIFTVLSKDGYTYAESQSAADKNSINKSYTLNDSDSYSSISDTITIEGTQIKLNQTKIADLCNTGWILTLGIVDQEISANATTTVSFKTVGGKTLSAPIKNPSNNVSTLKECVITGITRGYLDDAELSLENNIITNLTYTDYIDIFGTPKKIYFYEKYDGDAYLSSEVYITFEDASGRTLEVAFTDKKNDVELYDLLIES